MEPSPTPEKPVEYIIVQKIEACNSPNEGCDGYIIPGKHFKILEQQGDWLYVRVFDLGAEKSGWNWWIQASETAYYPEGEVPPPTPTPERPPTAVCEVPHWPERTPDRQTGYFINFGNTRQLIFPDAPYVMWYLKMPDGSYVFRRDARITEIDKENQTIVFSLSDGSTRQRGLTPNTQIVMWAHEIYRGMPSNQVLQSGGNFCDLEVGDVVSMLHPSEPESANPNPSLIDLWSVYIVQ